MTAPTVPVSDDALLARLAGIRPALRDMADGDGTPEERAGARLALSCVEDAIRDIGSRSSS